MSAESNHCCLIRTGGVMLAAVVLGAVAASQGLSAPTNLVVAADGTGQFKTVQEAVLAVPAGTPASRMSKRLSVGSKRMPGNTEATLAASP